MAGRYLPGAKVRLEDIRQAFGVSWSPIREAVTRLVSEGLMVVDSQKGYRVAPATRAELEEALAFGAQHLLLDNLSPAEAIEWIRFVRKRATIELSGGMRLDKLRDYAVAGPDFISVGALTHSAVAVDLNFRLYLED